MKNLFWNPLDMSEMFLEEAKIICAVFNSAWKNQGETLAYNENHPGFWDVC